jgi:hypothetical protein
MKVVASLSQPHFAQPSDVTNSKQGVGCNFPAFCASTNKEPFRHVPSIVVKASLRLIV